MNFKNILDDYLETNGRVNIKIQIMSSKLYLLQYPRRTLEEQICFPCHPLQMLKILMLLHYCHINNLLRSESIFEILSIAEDKPSNDIFQNMIRQKLNAPYKLYLQKKIMLINDQDLTAQQLFLRDINLLTRGSSFCDILYTFGRYYKHKYEFAADFNLILGKDLELIYNRMKRLIPKRNKIFMINQLESIHEKLYIIYYNCYYFRQMKYFIPKWVNTDAKLQLRKKTPTKSLMNKSMVSTAHSSPNQNCNKFEESLNQKDSKLIENKNYLNQIHRTRNNQNSEMKMSQSVLVERSFSGRMNDQEQTRIQLIKSMERILEEMDD